MKKIVLAGLFSIIISALFAQDAKKIKSYLDAKQYDKAKAEVDAAIAKNPSDPTALYFKGKVYAALASDAQFKASIPDAREQAFEAFKKSLNTDKDSKVLFIAMQDQYKPIFDIYSGYYDEGANYFNNGASKNSKEDFDLALSSFKNADMVGRYIYSKKWALSEIDTQLVLTMGKAAINAGRKDETLIYLKKLADANISGTANDKASYALPYQWLTFYYKDAKDEANFMKYSAMGKKYFPKDDYYDAVMLDYYRDKKDYDALFKKYDDIIAAYPDSLQYHFNYANEAFNYAYSDAGLKMNNREVILKNVGTELQKSLAAKPNDINTNWLLGQYYFNGGVDLKEEANLIKSTKPEDLRKKTDLNSQAKVLFNTAIPYGEKALITLELNGGKKADKSKYKSIADLMQRIYNGLGQADKVKIYQQKYDTADAKFIN